jgi:hypothetical protein
MAVPEVECAMLGVGLGQVNVWWGRNLDAGGLRLYGKGRKGNRKKRKGKKANVFLLRQTLD